MTDTGRRSVMSLEKGRQINVKCVEHREDDPHGFANTVVFDFGDHKNLRAYTRKDPSTLNISELVNREVFDLSPEAIANAVGYCN